MALCYEQIHTETGEGCVIRLNTDGLTFDHKDTLQEYLRFNISRAYPNLLSNRQLGWDAIFSHVNHFFATLTDEDQIKIAKTLALDEDKIGGESGFHRIASFEELEAYLK